MLDNEIKNELNSMKNDLTLFCAEHKIPMFCVFADEEDKETKYIGSAVTPHDLDIELKNDKITKYAASMNKNFVIRFKNTDNEVDEYNDAIIDMFD